MRWLAFAGREPAANAPHRRPKQTGNLIGHMSSHTYELTHLEALESESIHIIREVAAEFERPVLLFSGGKDSVIMLHLAAKAFFPARIPFPVMHIDTGHNFPEVLDFRDRTVEKLCVRLVVASVEEALPDGPRARAPGRHPDPVADGDVARRDQRARLRRGVRRRPPRRGEGQGEG